MSMTTVAAFNTLFKTFVEDLSQTFPEEPKLALLCESFDELVKVNARKPMELFVAALAPHADLVMTKNAALFDRQLDVAGIDIAALWKSEDLTDGSRQAVWQYLHSLFLLGTTALHVPPELLDTIESVAQTCASRMQNGEMDMTSMASMFLQGMGSVAGGLPAGNVNGLGGLGALGGLAAALQQPPALPNGTGDKNKNKSRE